MNDPCAVSDLLGFKDKSFLIPGPPVYGFVAVANILVRANINPYKLAFWMLSYILFDPQLHLALREETSRAYQNGAIDVPHLLEQCPRVDATYQEALRVANGALSARKIVAPTQLGSKVLGSGNTILIPFSIPATALQQRRIWQRSRPF